MDINKTEKIKVTIQRAQKFTCENFKKFKKVKKFTFNFWGS